MKKIGKKTLALLVCLATMMANTVSGFAVNSANWSLTANPYESPAPQTVVLTTHGSGYKAYATNIGGSSPWNYVVITAPVALDKEVKFSKTGTEIEFNVTSPYAEYYIPFSVQLYWAGGYTAVNNGTIEIN